MNAVQNLPDWGPIPASAQTLDPVSRLVDLPIPLAHSSGPLLSCCPMHGAHPGLRVWRTSTQPDPLSLFTFLRSAVTTWRFARLSVSFTGTPTAWGGVGGSRSVSEPQVCVGRGAGQLAPPLQDSFKGAGRTENRPRPAGTATPIKSTDLSQEGGADPQVLGDHIEAEEVSVNASTRHGQAVHVLVLLRGFPEETLEVCFLGHRTGE